LGPGPKVLDPKAVIVVPSSVRRWAGFEGGALAAGGVLVGALVLVAERPTACHAERQLTGNEGRQKAADYYTADTENGDHIDDPSEDALFALIGDLNDSDTTFITIEPATGGSTWDATNTKSRPAMTATASR
jgi:hypothetical protein